MSNAGLNRYLADQLGLSIDVFDGQGGFWRAARERGVQDHQINSLISGYDAQFERDGTPRSQASYANLGVSDPNGGPSGTSMSDFQSRMDELRDRLTSTFQAQVGSQRDMIDDLRRRLALAGRESLSPQQTSALMNARYTQAGRSRGNLGAVFGTTNGGGAGPMAGLIF